MMEDNIKQVVKDVKYLIATNCNDETIQARIENFIKERDEALNVIKVEKLDNKTSDTCECIKSTDIFQKNGFIICVECGKKVKLQSCS